MRKRFLNVAVLFLAVCCCPFSVFGADGGGRPHDFVVSSYIRANFFETGRVSSESMNACTDLIFMACSPYPDGRLCFEIPDNQASFDGGVEYLSAFQGRKGVISFDGTGRMNAGYDLLNTADSGVKQFTFATWIYVDEWLPGGVLFQKKSDGHNVVLSLGSGKGCLQFSIDGVTENFKTVSLPEDGWHYVALSYNAAGGSYLYVDGSICELSRESDVAGKPVPFMQTEMFLGRGLKAKFDNTLFNAAALTVGEVKRLQRTDDLKYDSWRMSKILAYWKYDNADNMGEDKHTWKHVMENIRSGLVPGGPDLRLGITSGAWEKMCVNPESRKVFAVSLKRVLDTFRFDGVDLDFEWPDNTEEGFKAYGETVKIIREVIGNDYIFSVSLHPVSYKMPEDAVHVLDFISIQAYGPRPIRFPYSQFVKDVELVMDYGLPKDKLVIGVPFYGVESDGKLGTESYFEFVSQGLVTDPGQNTLVYKGKNYVFDGQDAIRKKTRFVIGQGLKGMMSWDLATDVPFTDSRSLLKVMVEEIGK